MRVELFPDEGSFQKRQGKVEKLRRSPADKMRDKVDISLSSRDGQGKLARVRRMIGEGVYSRPSFTEAIAEKLMDSGALKKNKNNADKSPTPDEKGREVPEERRDKIENARRRVRSGDYMTSRVLDRIASRLIDQIGTDNDSE